MEKIIIGCDHGGFELKEAVKKFLKEGYEDITPELDKEDDYPDIALEVANKVAGTNALGIIICGTGIGVSITANKVKGIRAALCHNEFTAQMAREHNNANVLCMGGRVLEEAEALKIVKKFLETKFSTEERHNRRVKKMDEL